MTYYEKLINGLGFSQLKGDIWYRKTNRGYFIALDVDEQSDKVMIWRSDQDGNMLGPISNKTCASAHTMLLELERKEFTKK